MNDQEFRSLAKEELEAAEAMMEKTREELRMLLLPKDPDDGKNVIVEIRVGVGGEESALFAADLFRMYAMYTEKRGWQIEIANRSETELGGIREISFTPGEKAVDITTTLSAQEPTINPELLAEALRQLSPELAPDFAKFTRIETYDVGMQVYR